MGLALMASGCGSSEGVEEGATVTVYAAAGACRGAQQVLESEGSRVSSLHLRVRCLPAVEKHGRFYLATIGANARRTTEDSSTIAYIGEIEPAATRFSKPILEEAGIAQLPHMPGDAAMHELLNALERVDTSSGSLRESVRDELQ